MEAAAGRAGSEPCPFPSQLGHTTFKKWKAHLRLTGGGKKSHISQLLIKLQAQDGQRMGIPLFCIRGILISGSSPPTCQFETCDKGEISRRDLLFHSAEISQQVHVLNEADREPRQLFQSASLVSRETR